MNTRVLCFFWSCSQPLLLSPWNNKPDRNRKDTENMTLMLILLAHRFNNPHICMIISFKYLYKYIHITVTASASSTPRCAYMSIYSYNASIRTQPTVHISLHLLQLVSMWLWKRRVSAHILLIFGQLIIFNLHKNQNKLQILWGFGGIHKGETHGSCSKWMLTKLLLFFLTATKILRPAAHVDDHFILNTKKWTQTNLDRRNGFSSL